MTRKGVIAVIALAAMCAGLLALFLQPTRNAASIQPGADVDLVLGERLFSENCAVCHGQEAAGTAQSGPPLVHKIYEPSHHADGAFYLAVSKGVRAHHWPFGDMPPIKDVSMEETAHIIGYVRILQRQNGIF